MTQGHHLILGECTDYLTGEILQDTHDEQYRQKLARLLVETYEYPKTALEPRVEMTVRAGDKQAVLKLDLLARINDQIALIVKYAPGSIVTRERPVLAMGCILAPCQVPVAVVTNGEDAHVLNGITGELISSGLDSLPSWGRLHELSQSIGFLPVDARRAEMASRIIYAFEVDGSCLCDQTVCRLPDSM